VKAFIHTPEGDYEVESPFLRPDNDGGIVTLYGRDQDEYVNERPLATLKLSEKTFILYGEDHPKKRDEGSLIDFA
jgi:hypothetical protein